MGQNPGDKRLAEDNTDEELELPDAGKKGDRKRAANSKTNQKAQDAGEDDTTIGRRISKRKISTLKPPAEAASDDELGSPKKKRKFTAKVTKSNFEEAASLRRSGRGQGVHKPPAVNEEDEGPEPATGGKRKAEAAAGKTASKKAKTSK